MESITEGTPPALAAMPRCEDGCIKLRELILRIVEDVANGVMAVEAEQMREAIGNDRNGYRGRRLETCAGAQSTRAQAQERRVLPGGRHRALSEGRPGVFRQEDLSKKSIGN